VATHASATPARAPARSATMATSASTAAMKSPQAISSVQARGMRESTWLTVAAARLMKRDVCGQSRRISASGRGRAMTRGQTYQRASRTQISALNPTATPKMTKSVEKATDPSYALLEIDALDAPVAAGEEDRVPLARDRARPPAARAHGLAELRRLPVDELVDVDAARAPARGHDGAVAHDVEQPAPAVAVAGHAVDRLLR